MQDNIERARSYARDGMLDGLPLQSVLLALADECEALRRGIDALTERLEELEPGVRVRVAAPFGVRGVTPQVGDAA